VNRRGFIQAFAGAVASVAIGMRVSQGMPRLNPADYLTDSDTWYLNPNIAAVKVKCTERFEFEYVDWRAMYGSSA